MKTFYVTGVLLLIGAQSLELQKDEKTNLRVRQSHTISSGSISEEVRFSSKISFNEESYQNNKDLIKELFPLKKENYPITSDVLHNLLTQSNAVSIVLPNDYECSQSIKEMIEIVGGEPTHAPNPEFWPELEKVIDLQILRRSNGDALASATMPWFPLPKLWRTFTMNEIADAVHADFPGYWHTKLMIQFLGGGFNVDNSIIPKRSESQFLHKQVMLSDINTWAISTVSSVSFGSKYYAGRARPEEVVWQIARKQGVFNSTPENIVDKIVGMNLTKMEEFTAYEDGAPVHPSWPAMHSAASALSMWLPVVTRLKVTQRVESKVMDLAISIGRTVAGVHYNSDNIAGLKMGQEVVARELPRYLATKYGADPMKVRNKIQKLRFNWDEEALRLMNLGVKEMKNQLIT